MHKENEELELPPKPTGPWEGAIVGGVIGAAIGFVMSKILRDKLPWTGILIGSGLVSGYTDGQRNTTEYELKVKNIKLEHRVHELEAGAVTPEAEPSFVKQVSEEAPACGCKGRA